MKIENLNREEVRYYLTENGNILNIQKKYFQTIKGHFLRLVLDDEIEYLKGVLTPIDFPKGIKEPETTPLWHFICQITDEDGCKISYFGRNNNGIFEFCHTLDCSDKELNDKDKVAKVFDVDTDYYVKSYSDDCDYIVLDNIAGFCKLEDVLSSDKYLTFYEVLERNKKLAEIGYYIDNFCFNNAEKFISCKSEISGSWYELWRFNQDSDEKRKAIKCNLYLPYNKRFFENYGYNYCFREYDDEKKLKVEIFTVYGDTWFEAFNTAYTMCQKEIEDIDKYFLDL